MFIYILLKVHLWLFCPCLIFPETKSTYADNTLLNSSYLFPPHFHSKFLPNLSRRSQTWEGFAKALRSKHISYHWLSLKHLFRFKDWFQSAKYIHFCWYHPWISSYYLYSYYLEQILHQKFRFRFVWLTCIYFFKDKMYYTVELTELDKFHSLLELFCGSQTTCFESLLNCTTLEKLRENLYHSKIE